MSELGFVFRYAPLAVNFHLVLTVSFIGSVAEGPDPSEERA
jgi:hypothetical protein